MAMTLTLLSLSLCGGLLSESAPSARLFAQSDELLAPPMPAPEPAPERRLGPTREELLESMPGLGGPIALLVGGAVLTVAAAYVIPYLVSGATGLIVMIAALVVGAVLVGVGIGTLVGAIVRRAKITRELRRMERSSPYGFEPLERAPAPAVAMLSFQLP